MSPTSRHAVVWAALALFFGIAAWFMLQVPARPAYGQHVTLGGVVNVEGSSKPSTFQGVWLRTTDFTEFEASTTKSKWLAPEQTLWFAKSGTAVTGALNMEASIPCDTTSDAEDGYMLPDSAYIVAIHATNEGVRDVADSLEVFQNNSRIYAAAWTGDYADLYPTNLVLAAHERLCVFIKSGATNPNRPLVRVVVRRFVSQ